MVDMVRRRVSEKLAEHKNDLVGVLIEEIRQNFNVRNNFANVIPGKQSRGKTVIALQEIRKIRLMRIIY